MAAIVRIQPTDTPRRPRLTVIEGWGHDLPEALWPRLADAVVSTGPNAP